MKGQQQRIRRAFGRAASDYDSLAVQQREVLQRLVTMALPHLRPGTVILDVGCGTGYLAEYLTFMKIDSRLIGIDAAEGMCRSAKQKGESAIAAQMEALPIADERCDLVFSSLAMQWSHDSDASFAEAFRVLRPGGVLCCSTYLEGTLHELATAYAALNLPVPLQPFHSVRRYTEAMTQAGLNVMSVQECAHPRRDAQFGLLLHYLKQLGAATPVQSAGKGLKTPEFFKQLEAAYPHTDGQVRSSWQVGYFMARKPQS